MSLWIKESINKLSSEKRKQVFYDIQNGKSCRILNKKYGVLKSTICNIQRKKSKEIFEAWEKKKLWYRHHRDIQHTRGAIKIVLLENIKMQMILTKV